MRKHKFPFLLSLGFALTGLCAALGCRGIPTGQPPGANGLPMQAVGNPIYVSGDSQFVFEQVVDTVDDYFKIENEQTIQVAGGALMPGRIDTFPVVGATLLEPWRKDYSLGPETLYNTLQVVRRFAVVEVIPDQGGFLVNVQVMRELEDLAQPERATVGQQTRRHDGSLVQIEENFKREGPVRLGWIPIGRDLALEQRILSDIQGRLNLVQPVALPPVQP